MKKTLIMASLLAFMTTTAAFAAETQVPTDFTKKGNPPMECQKPPGRPDAKRQEEFDKRLNLTDVQKEQAKQIRKKGHDEMKPVMEKMKAKHMEAEAVKKSKIAPEAQQAKLDKIFTEKKELKMQAHELRKKNMKEFEAILTPAQQKELTKMKEEGRKKFEESKKNRPQNGCQKRPECGCDKNRQAK